MDFFEIRRKAKQRAEARARVGAAPAPAPALDSAPAVAAAAPAPPPAADAAPALQPLEAVVQAVAAAGGELTPIPDLPPWRDALDTATPPPGAWPPAAEDTRPAWSSPAPLWNAPPAAPVDPLDEFFYRPDEVVPGLADLDFAQPVAPAPVEVVDPQREYLTFRLGDEEYAVDIERVREVLKAPLITDVPRAPHHVLGVIMVRGDVIAVFDPRKRLGLPEVDRPASPRVLVCDDGLGQVGLLVDAVSQVVRLRRSDIEPRPQGIGGVSAEYIAGIGRQAGRLFIVLDLPVVLRGKATAEAEAER